MCATITTAQKIGFAIVDGNLSSSTSHYFAIYDVSDKQTLPHITHQGDGMIETPISFGMSAESWPGFLNGYEVLANLKPNEIPLTDNIISRDEAGKILCENSTTFFDRNPFFVYGYDRPPLKQFRIARRGMIWKPIENGVLLATTYWTFTDRVTVNIRTLASVADRADYIVGLTIVT